MLDSWGDDHAGSLMNVLLAITMVCSRSAGALLLVCLIGCREQKDEAVSRLPSERRLGCGWVVVSCFLGERGKNGE